MRLLISENRIEGKRLVLRDGKLTVERCRQLEPAQIALIAQAAVATIEVEPEKAKT
jgi:hypothetical protein